MGRWGSNLEESWCHLRHSDANGLVRVAVSSHQSRAESWGSARPSSIAERPLSWGPARNEKKMSHEICLSRCSLGPMNQYRPLVTLQESEPNKNAGNHLVHPGDRSYCHCQQFKFRKANSSAAIADVPLPGPPWSHVSSLASKSIETPGTRGGPDSDSPQWLRCQVSGFTASCHGSNQEIYTKHIYIYLFIYRWKKYVIRNIWKYHIESHGVIQLAVDFQNFSPCWDDPMVMAWATPVSWDGARWMDVWKWNNGIWIGREREIYIYICVCTQQIWLRDVKSYNSSQSLKIENVLLVASS